MELYKQRSFLFVREKIEQFCRKIASFHSLPDFTDKSVLDLIIELQTFVREKDLDTIYEELKHDELILKSVEQIRQFYSLYVLSAEVDMYLSYFDGRSRENNAYASRASGFAKLEGNALGLNSDSKVLFVGSGPLPETALTCVRLFGCKVTCLDNNPETVFLIKKLMRKIKLERDIDVLFGDARDFDYAGYSNIILAVMAQPKNDILKRICATSDRNLNVSCRTVKGLKSLLYKPANDLRLNHFSIGGYVEGGAENIVHSIILTHKAH